MDQVLEDWERIINGMAKTVIGEKLIVSGRAATLYHRRRKTENYRQSVVVSDTS